MKRWQGATIILEIFQAFFPGKLNNLFDGPRWGMGIPVVEETIESKVIDLSTESFRVVCDDLSAMFEVDVSCEPIEVGIQTVKGLQKTLKDLCALHTIKAEGTLENSFHLVFDQGGLFTLAGVIIMSSKKRVLDKIIGLITVFDILRVLIPQDKVSWTRRTPQAPCLMT